MNNLDAMFPNKQWESFELNTNIVINNWNSPIIIDRYPTYPMYPTYPWITYEGSTSNADLINDCEVNYNSGTYNIEIK